MPPCSQCHQQKERLDFTKVQLRKIDATRRCKECVHAVQSQQEQERSRRQEGMRRGGKQMMRRGGGKQKKAESHGHLRIKNSNFKLPPPPPPPRVQPLSQKMKAPVREAIRMAVSEVIERGYPPNVGLDGFGRSELEARLWQVANNEVMLWLTGPFLVGLANGKKAINKRVHFVEGGEPTPILHWLCQYQLLISQFNYCGKDDMVALALAAGAKVSLKVANNCTALFFAVKYTSARTVELLLEAGSRADQRDVYGQTIWKNAVERPNPAIIETLIERCNDVIPAANQKFVITHMDSGIQNAYNLPDQMLSNFAGMLSSSDHPGSTIPISWQALGAPEVEDVAIALIRVMQAGARFSPTNEALPENNIDADPLAYATHIDSPRTSTQDLSQQQIDIIRSLSDVIYGSWLPKTIREEVQNTNQTHTSETTCLICLDEMEPASDPVTLYCGHRFCLDCIRKYGEAPINDHNSLKGSDKRCPTCRRLLCGDLLPTEYNKNYRSRRYHFGIDRHDATEPMLPMVHRGPHLLSDEQLRFECKAMIGKTEGTREDLLEELLAAMEKYATMGQGDGLHVGDKIIPTREEDLRIELAASTTLAVGTENPTMYVAPMRGPVVLPIEIKGVSILASISPNSVFTVVSPSIVDTFNLKTKPISSSQFRSPVGGRPVPVSAVVDELKFLLGNVEICLNNAFILRDSNVVRSIQLGMDFFESAIWARCSARIAGGMFVVTDGGYNKHMLMKYQADEIRYYSRDGKICQLPFIHVTHLDETHTMPVISLPDGHSTKFGECQWCCRYFPCDGMLKCPYNGGPTAREYRYYCDEECKTKAMVLCAGFGDV